MEERRERGERHDAGVTRNEIIQYLFETDDWVPEPEIRHFIYKRLGITEPKSTKIQLANALKEDLVQKKSEKGVNYWKINQNSLNIHQFVDGILSKFTSTQDWMCFYQSQGMKNYLLNIDWKPRLQDFVDLCGGYGRIQSLRPIKFDKDSNTLKILIDAVLLSPTLFMAITHPDIKYFLNASLVFGRLKGIDDILYDYDEDGQRFEYTLRQINLNEIYFGCFLFSCMSIDYFRYKAVRDSIVAFFYHISKKPHMPFDQLLKEIEEDIPNLTKELYNKFIYDL